MQKEELNSKLKEIVASSEDPNLREKISLAIDEFSANFKNFKEDYEFLYLVGLSTATLGSKKTFEALSRLNTQIVDPEKFKQFFEIYIDNKIKASKGTVLQMYILGKKEPAVSQTTGNEYMSLTVILDGKVSTIPISDKDKFEFFEDVYPGRTYNINMIKSNNRWFISDLPNPVEIENTLTNEEVIETIQSLPALNLSNPGVHKRNDLVYFKCMVLSKAKRGKVTQIIPMLNDSDLPSSLPVTIMFQGNSDEVSELDEALFVGTVQKSNTNSGYLLWSTIAKVLGEEEDSEEDESSSNKINPEDEKEPVNEEETEA